MSSSQDLFKRFENKPVKVLTKNDLRYFTRNLQVIGDSIIFNDKYDNEVMIALSEVAKIEEVHNAY